MCCETDLAADQSTGCRTWNRRSRQTRSGDKTNSERKWKARKEKRRVKWHRFREGRTCSCCHHLPTCAVASVLSHTKHAAGSVDEKVARTSTRCYFQWKSRLFILDTQPCGASSEQDYLFTSCTKSKVFAEIIVLTFKMKLFSPIHKTYSKNTVSVKQ